MTAKKKDILSALKPDAELHPQFIQLRDAPVYEPARGMLREVFTDFEDPDGNFVEQFQTTGFDSRTFEIYLFALLREAGFKVDRSHTSPDFLIEKDGFSVCVESVTANPPPAGITPYHAIPNPPALENAMERLLNEIPIRFGSPLFSKLNKKYWELPHVTGKPLVIAIQSFHEAGALTISSAPLIQYLYGNSYHWYHDKAGELIVSTQPIDTHTLGAKEIPSGFFFQPNSENISGVLFSNSGTIAKFNRIGHEGDYTAENVRMLRVGTRYQHNPNAAHPAPFIYEVGDEEGAETWSESAVLIHNPNALFPIPKGFLGTSADVTLIDGETITDFHEPFHVLQSITQCFTGLSTEQLQSIADATIAPLIALFGLPTDLE